MKRLALLLVSIMLLANTGCTTEEEAETREPMPNPAETLLDEQTETEAWEVHEATKVHITFHATIENPTSGALLSAYLVLPPTPKNSTEKYPIAVMIPGGTDYGTNAYGKDTHIREFILEKEIGFAYFDPDGRGESAGEENANGHIHQDGLFAVTEALTQHTNVDTNKMGIISYSYGTTLASGMLSRYADQNPYKWYLDWEGPSKREYTTVNCKGDLGNVILNIVAT
jgi:predicted peptidase